MKPDVEKVELDLFLKGELKTDDDPVEDASAAKPPEAELKFTIGPDGKVVSMSIKSSTTNNAKFDEEIKKKVSEWNFGEAGAGNTTVTIPFVFSE